MNTTARYAIATIVIHAAVSVLHKIAHLSLDIKLSVTQEITVVFLFILAPIAVLVLLWTSRLRSGFMLLVVAMSGEFIFGGVNHFVFVTNDHVMHAPQGDLLWLFRVTAYVMALLEAVGVVVGVYGLMRASKLTSETVS